MIEKEAAAAAAKVLKASRCRKLSDEQERALLAAQQASEEFGDGATGLPPLIVIEEADESAAKPAVESIVEAEESKPEASQEELAVVPSPDASQELAVVASSSVAATRELLLEMIQEQHRSQQSHDAFNAWAEDAYKLVNSEAQHWCDQVRASGYGVCSSCRWMFGCHRCHFPKAVRYFFNKELKDAGLSKKLTRSLPSRAVSSYGG